MNTLVDKSQVAAKIKLIFREKLGVEEANLTPNASLYNDLGLDSLDVLDFIFGALGEQIQGLDGSA